MHFATTAVSVPLLERNKECRSIHHHFQPRGTNATLPVRPNTILSRQYMYHMQIPEASEEQALQHLQDMRLESRPSLYMGQQLPWSRQLQVVPSPAALHNHPACIRSILSICFLVTPGSKSLRQISALVRIQARTRLRPIELDNIL
jgi:hypothetical protein